MENMKSMKDLVNTKKASQELPVGAVSREMNEKMRTLKNFEEWVDAFSTIHPYYIYEDHAIKIVDQKCTMG